jgi:osmotically-inducible protein OsmY
MFLNTSSKFIVLALSIFVLNACSSMLSATRDEPIEENYGKRTPGAYVDDQFIETKSKVNLKKVDSRFKDAQIYANSYNGVVLLVGNVADQDMRTVATDTVQKIRKVRRVHNELTLSPPRSFTAGIGDYWLRQKVKTKFMFDRSIESSRVKVVAYNGTIYLMGLATRQEADNIVDRAKSTYGLQKIVRVFEYIDQQS